MTPPRARAALNAMSVSLHCEHGRWLGPANFGACHECIHAALAAAVEEALEQAAEGLDEWAAEIADVRHSIDHRDWIKCAEDEWVADGIRRAAADIRARKEKS